MASHNRPEVVQEFINWLYGSSFYWNREHDDDADRSQCNSITQIKSELATNGNNRILKLLKAVSHINESPFLRDRAKSILLGYTAVFCILLTIDGGPYIHTIIRHGALKDMSLPYTSKEIPHGFPCDNDLFDKFCEAQWRFCPHTFERGTECILDERHILPITLKEYIGRGSSASVYRIQIHPHYNKLLEADELTQSSNPEDQQSFALKTYVGNDAQEVYEAEKQALQNLKTTTEGIIRHYMSFKHGKTYNIILEYAESGNLESFFNEMTPPSDEEAIVNFWKKLFVIPEVLQAMGASKYQKGYHNDLKPGNILVTGNREDGSYMLKVGDLGSSVFVPVSDPSEKASAPDAQCTQTYGAPEILRLRESLQNIPINVGPEVDIFALGCIFSESAVWLVKGNIGRKQYAASRKLELGKQHQNGDYFHNGQALLEAVGTYHDVVKKSRRCNDRITEHVVDILLPGMLKIDPKKRSQALGVCNTSTGILENAEKNLMPVRGQPNRLPPNPPPMINSLGQTGTVRYQNSTIETGYLTQSPVEADLTAGFYFDRASPTRGHSARPERALSYSGTLQQIVEPPGTSTNRRRYQTLPSITGLDGNRSHHQNGSVPLLSTPRRQTSGRGQPSHNTADRQEYIHRDSQISWRQPMSHEAPPNSLLDTREGSHHQDSPSELPGMTSPHIPRDRFSDSMGFMSPTEVQEWMKKRKRLGKREQDGYLPPSMRKEYWDRLKRRDHILVFDNSVIMENCWSEVVTLAPLLTYILKLCDDDGIEVFYTMDDCSDHPKKSTTLKQTLERKGQHLTGVTNMARVLNNIFERIQNPPRRSNTRAWGRRPRPERPSNDTSRPVTIYIFTCGYWKDCDAVRESIQKLTSSLYDRGLRKSVVGIQFISFGDYQAGIDEMNHLDSDLGADLDIVDHESSRGNLLKILLGSIDPRWDADDQSIPHIANGIQSNMALRASQSFNNTGFRGHADGTENEN